MRGLLAMIRAAAQPGSRRRVEEIDERMEQVEAQIEQHELRLKRLEAREALRRKAVEGRDP